MSKEGKAERRKRVLTQFGARFQSWLDRHGLNQAQFVTLANRKTIDDGRVSRILGGLIDMRLSSAEEIVGVLGLTLEEFYVGQEKAGLERRFGEELEAFRDLINIADREAIADVRKAFRHIKSDLLARRSETARGSPSKERRELSR